MRPVDWPAVRDIYDQGIATGDATFESSAPPWEAFDAAHLPEPRIVLRDGELVLAWAALVAVSAREVYRGVADVSVYVRADQRGHGLGRMILTALIERSEACGVLTLQAGVFPENEASLALHSACGFRVVGTRERIGRMGGRWRDVVVLERRSPTP
jgi:phosphinothricin acetyltransferase